MKIIPYNSWPIDINNFDYSLLEFKWNATKFFNNDRNRGEMHIKLIFNSPGSISP